MIEMKIEGHVFISENHDIGDCVLGEDGEDQLGPVLAALDTKWVEMTIRTKNAPDVQKEAGKRAHAG